MAATTRREFRPSRSFLIAGVVASLGCLVFAVVPAAFVALFGRLPYPTFLDLAPDGPVSVHWIYLVGFLVILAICAYPILFWKNARIVTTDDGIEATDAWGRRCVQARWEEVFTLELRARRFSFSPYNLGVDGRLITLPNVDGMDGTLLQELARRLPHLAHRLTVGF